MTVVPGRLSTRIEYPSVDGEAMAESDFQGQPLTYAMSAQLRAMQQPPTN